MTVEERAKSVTDEVGTATTGAELRALIVQALRDQIEDCAKILDRKAEDWKHSMKTIKHFTGTYDDVEFLEEMAEAIRALATPKEEEKEKGD